MLSAVAFWFFTQHQDQAGERKPKRLPGPPARPGSAGVPKAPGSLAPPEAPRALPPRGPGAGSAAPALSAGGGRPREARSRHCLPRPRRSTARPLPQRQRASAAGNPPASSGKGVLCTPLLNLKGLSRSQPLFPGHGRLCWCCARLSVLSVYSPLPNYKLTPQK